MVNTFSICFQLKKFDEKRACVISILRINKRLRLKIQNKIE